MTTSWTVAIDWDRNGDFSVEHDDITQGVLLAEWFVECSVLTNSQQMTRRW